MSKLRLIFILSLVILVGVFIATIHFIPSEQSYNDSKRMKIIEGEDEWIVQCDIINTEDREVKYSLYFTIDGVIHKDSTVIKQGKTYTYIHHIYPAQLEEGRVTFTLYQEGSVKPIEQATYYIIDR